MKAAQLYITGIAAWVVLAGVVIVTAYDFATTEVNSVITTDYKSFALIAGVGLTLLTSIFSAIMSLMSQIAQRDAAESIELLKDRVSASRKAKDFIYSAAGSYYHTLAKLERGRHEKDELEACEKLCVQAQGYLKDVPNEVKEKFIEFWTCARRLNEECDESEAVHKDIWVENVREFGKIFNELEGRLRADQDAEP